MGTENPGQGALTAPKPGSHPERWSAELLWTPTASSWAPDKSGNNMNLNSIPVSLMSVETI